MEREVGRRRERGSLSFSCIGRKPLCLGRRRYTLLSSLQALGGKALTMEGCEGREGDVEGIPEQLRAAQSQSELAR